MHAAAWILDVGHRARRLDCAVSAGQLPLAAITSAGAELGLVLEGPLGARIREDKFESMFVLPHRGEGEEWEPFGAWAASDDAVGAEHARVEGEGDGPLEDWRDGHERFFRREAAAVGLTFTDRSVIFFERFEVLAVFGASDRAVVTGS